MTMNKNLSFNLSTETYEILNKIGLNNQDSEKEITKIFETMMINYMIIKGKVDEGYKVFLGKEKENIAYEYKLEALN